MAVGWPARPDCRPLTAQQPGEPRKSYYLKWGWAPEVSFGFPFIFSLRAGGPIRRRVGRRGFAILTSHFTREVCNFCEKVTNRLHRTPTFKSVIIDETSMKKSLFLSRILNYRRKVLQKLSLQKSFFRKHRKTRWFWYLKVTHIYDGLRKKLIWCDTVPFFFRRKYASFEITTSRETQI